jgi:hypothetical protein
VNYFEKQNIDTFTKDNLTLQTLIATAVLMEMEMEPTPAVVATTVIIPVISQNIDQKFRATAIRRLVWKLDRRLIPFLVLLEISSYINRLSIGMCF